MKCDECVYIRWIWGLVVYGIYLSLFVQRESIPKAGIYKKKKNFRIAQNVRAVDRKNISVLGRNPIESHLSEISFSTLH